MIGPSTATPVTWFRVLLLGLLWLAVSRPSAAQPVIPEVEPNNTPATATAVTGAAVIMGSMADGDQDGFRWTVSDVGAQTRWTFELQGIPGALTVVDVLRVEYADNGVDVVGRKKLLTIGSRDGVTPAVASDLLFEPGEYLLGIARGGGRAAHRPPVAAAQFDAAVDGPARAPQAADPRHDAYRLTIREGSRVVIRTSPTPHDSPTSAATLRPGAEYVAYTPVAATWFALDLTAKEAGERYEIAGQVPVGRNAAVFLRDASGKELARTTADARGQFTFQDLGLAAGTSTVDVQAGGGDLVLALVARAVGRRVEGAESEPNDRWERANGVDFSVPLTGRMGRRGESDYFSFVVDEAAADRLQTLTLETDAKTPLQLCLLDRAGRSLQCRERAGGVELAGLRLAQGQYGVLVARGAAGASYTVTWTPGAEPASGTEAEPNDTLALASTIPANNRITATFGDPDDVDVYRLVVTGRPQLWRIQVNGDQVHEVAYHDGSGVQHQRVRARAGQRRVGLDNVFLLPGAHHVSVKGRGAGAYTLLAVPVGQPDPNSEREPNDDTGRMQRLAIGQTRTGLLEDAGDRDNYRFFLANWDHIRLEVTPPSDGAIQAVLHWDTTPIRRSAPRGPGRPLVLEGVFPPGDYRIVLSPLATSEAEYRLSLQRRDRFTCPADCEPNDDPAFAQPVPPTLVVAGQVGEWEDQDWWTLPVLERESAIVIRSTDRRDLALVASLDSNTRSIIAWDETSGAYRGVVPAGTATYLQVKPSGVTDYRIALQFADGPKAASPEPAPPVRLGLELDAATIAAYHPHGQLVAGRITLTHQGVAAVTVGLDVTTSDRRFRATLDLDRLTLAGGGRETVALAVHAPADAWAAAPVRVSVRAIGPAGTSVGAHAEMAVDPAAAAVNPRRVWTVPESLRGGFNVAQHALGGRRVRDPAETTPGIIPRVGDGFDLLFDGMTVRNRGLSLRGGHGDLPVVPVTVELSGESPVEVAGFAFQAFGQYTATRNPKDVVLQLSTDGATFETVATARLDPVPHEQFVSLPQPRPARFARLLLDTTWEGRGDGALGLGEWKVIARPGLDISRGRGFNLAAPELGGHVVSARPAISVHWDDSVLTERGDVQRVRVDAGQPLEWVIGFHHTRAAQITRLEWVDSAQAHRDKRIRAVTVAVSRESPVGPWQKVGEWTLPAGGGAAEFRLDAPVWARFVRFTTPAAEARDIVEAPDAVRIWERPTGADYQSILTEWGDASPDAYYESIRPLDTVTEAAATANGSRAQAAPLSPGRAVAGQVVLGRREAWYRIAVPAGQNTLAFTMSADPTVRTELHLETATGTAVALRRLAAESTPSAHVLEATVEAGSTVFARVQEPPRNVMFVWDTSGSVGPYIPIIYNSLIAYAEDLVPGRDTANLLPFGTGRPMLRDWHSEPYVLQTVLNERQPAVASSDAERALYLASKELATRAGTKAIVLMTDAVTPRLAEVWDALAAVQPRVFAFGVSVMEATPQDLQQSWARVNGGHYTYVMNEGEMEVAFERVAAMLRQPAPYTLAVESRFREAPGPGRLTVVTGGAPAKGAAAASGAAIEFILDASGSMLQRLDGKRRIEIARDVLTATVRGAIPAGTPVALRVFGHREAGSCRTDLEAPLAPLDAVAMARRIQAVGAMNLAKTPIADSLAKVEADLRGAKGRKVVVLVTDGEETCGGDPEKVVRELRDKGVDVTLNIVGFAIGDAALEGQFERWAELGGGRYFSARDQAALAAALGEAVKTPFSVFDESGSQVGRGVVDGEPVTLPAGRYRVVVAGPPARTFEGVELAGKQSLTLPITGSRPRPRE
jgi:Mg-chelatase subunit ChlD